MSSTNSPNDIKALFTDTLSIASGLATLISVPTSVIQQSYLLGSAALLFTSVFIYRILSIIRLIRINSKHINDWEYVSQATILDFVDDQGEVAQCTIRFQLKCLVSSNSFFYKIYPADKISNVVVTGGTIQDSDETANELEIVIKLGNIVPVNSIVDIEVRLTLTDAFPKNFESWTISKYYAGNNYKLKILLPDKRPAKSITASIVPQGRMLDKVEYRECVKYDYINNRPVIEVIENNNRLTHNHDLLLQWHW